MKYGRVLVTGAAGFIGFFLTKRLLASGIRVTGVDNLNDYYDVSLKEARLAMLKSHDDFTFHRVDIADSHAVEEVFRKGRFDVVVNLAAQAGVRYSLENPQSYIRSNLTGFGNVLEGCRHHGVKHLVFASSSSVYGANTKMPFSVHHNVDHPVSLYAATKKSNELMAHSYAHLYGLPVTGLRFFTVYGPWGRPDMAHFIFTRNIFEGKPIKVFNHGKSLRDFTYIDDIVEGVVRLMGRLPEPDAGWRSDAPDPGSSYAPYRIYNIGNNDAVELMEFIEVIEKEIGIKAEKEFLPLQPGDVPATYADIDDLTAAVDFSPRMPLAAGIRRFVAWYRDYYGVQA